jgi:shikimate dehydrogenase/3-dehydroquinate dehydratase type I
LDRYLRFPAYIAAVAPRDFEDARKLAALAPAGATAVEFRLDLASVRISPRALGDLEPRGVIVTYRTAREGGRFDGSPEEYRKSLQSAYDAGATVDVELESGFLDDPAFLPDRRRVIASRHGDFEFSGRLVERYLGVEAAAVKLVNSRLASHSDLFASMSLMREASRRRPVSFFTMGRGGVASRVLGPSFGASLVYGSVSAPTGDCQLPLRELLEVYGAGRAEPAEKLYAVCGGDVGASLSPRIHNALFRSRQRNDLYFPASSLRASPGNGGSQEAELRDLLSPDKPVFGLSVTNPFKAAALRLATQADDAAAGAGAANTLLRGRGARIAARNTDVAAVREALAGRGGEGKRMVILGAGGAASAAAYAGRASGSEVIVVARDPARAGALAGRMGASARPLADLPRLEPGVLVNATPLGASDDEMAFPPGMLASRPIVLDFAYRRVGDTPLASAARESGCSLADGLELLARQAVGQAHLFGVADATLEEITDILERR